jgi:FAD/FMN-containing dehydrogenase
MCGVIWCYTGAPDRFDQTFAPVRRWPKPAFEMVGPMPFPALQSMFDAFYAPGLQWYWRSDIVDRLSSDSIRLNAEHGAALPTLHSTMHLYPINGAVHRVKEDATTWVARDSTWVQVIVGVDPDPANNEKTIKWAKSYSNAVHPFNSAAGGYVNMMMEEGQERVQATYGKNYERLREVKARYDPDNLFRVNQNIKPAETAGRQREGKKRLAS